MIDVLAIRAALKQVIDSSQSSGGTIISIDCPMASSAVNPNRRSGRPIPAGNLAVERLGDDGIADRLDDGGIEPILIDLALQQALLAGMRISPGQAFEGRPRARGKLARRAKKGSSSVIGTLVSVALGKSGRSATTNHKRTQASAAYWTRNGCSALWRA